jgi:hypothetical protein
MLASLEPQVDCTTIEPPTAQYVRATPLATNRPEPCTLTCELAPVLTSAGVTMLTLATEISSTDMELLLQSCPFTDSSTVLLPAPAATVRHAI